jgi:dihydroflavonol-4-reductase
MGRRYILGNAEGNLALREFLRLLAQAAGAPVARPPKESPVRAVRRVLTKPAPQTGHLPAALTCDCRRAVEELGMPQTPLRQALSEAVEWFRQNEYMQ